MLQDNDAYHALEKVDGLITTGATGTNVNDVAVLLIRRRRSIPFSVVKANGTCYNKTLPNRRTIGKLRKSAD